jgi:cytochrome c peroxidase
MKKNSILILIIAFWSGCKPNDTVEELFIGFKKPTTFPAPTYPFQSNTVTKAGFALGRKLFYDGKLSRDGTISCGSCHIQYSAFTHHGHRVSHGIDDLLGTRNTPPIQNMAWATSFFWDGGVHNLDMVPFNPISNPVEMDETVANVITKLQNDANYPALFQQAFGSSEINSMRIMQALSQFMAMLISANSRYDQYINGATTALNSQEIAGLALFNANCATCHPAPLFTNNEFRNNGIDTTNDVGRYAISLNPADRFRFKVPSLRNIAKTPPYMHNGTVPSLEAAVAHYTAVQHSSTLDTALQQNIPLTTAEQEQIIAFLNSLTDEEFIRNPDFSEQ